MSLYIVMEMKDETICYIYMQYFSHRICLLLLVVLFLYFANDVYHCLKLTQARLSIVSLLHHDIFTITHCFGVQVLFEQLKVIANKCCLLLDYSFSVM